MLPSSKLKEILGRVYDGAREGPGDDLTAEEYENRRRDFVFHMTDWEDDLKELVELFEKPDQHDEEAACIFVIGFLYHVVPHLNAAGRLLLDEIGDPFAPVDHKKQP